MTQNDSDSGPIEFGDIDPDDAYSAGDDEVDWSQVDRVAEQIGQIQDIEDDGDRLAAAKQWAADLAGE